MLLYSPWQQNIFSSTMAATGRQLKQSVKVFHNLILYLRLPKKRFKIFWQTSSDSLAEAIQNTLHISKLKELNLSFFTYIHRKIRRFGLWMRIRGSRVTRKNSLDIWFCMPIKCKRKNKKTNLQLMFKFFCNMLLHPYCVFLRTDETHQEQANGFKTLFSSVHIISKE